ncbi:hypothetical protein GCM10011581_43490 [Saccharopolyspora subtropica]|uniref:Uncharacterized protein n=1 Tax=Saccharopolyspora thermophila TaxID=89367 RepID=A0A917K5A8_9PSEU|nr:hypothetical protein [Saccharopolyspora subtropica]GGJ01588.1 hypothetical protein GCM10011581_43490 [Saccharopolyspora subtropica]
MSRRYCSDWLADLARQIRAIEQDVETCTRRACIRRYGAPSSLETLGVRADLEHAADALESISKGWADEEI